MLLGNKIQHNNMLTMGNKKNTGIMLGNKINDQSNRRVYPLPTNNNEMKTSPIEKYNKNNY
jgi:hypothetical protein